MSLDLDASATELAKSPLLDQGLLKPGGRKEVEAAIARWRERGLRAHVVLLKKGEPLGPAHALWDRLALDRKQDLLLLFNGQHWEARGWGLSAPAIQAGLDRARAGLRTYYGRGLVMALEELGTLATGASAPARPVPPPATVPVRTPAPRSSSGWPIGIGAALLGGGIAWIIHRRRKVAGESSLAFEEARRSAEQAYADVLLSAEELPTEKGSVLQLQAADLKKRFDRVVEESVGKPGRMADPVTLGQMRQFENELAALRSTVLQKGREPQ